MKSNETKTKFVQLRAAGLSFEKISQQLDISKSTCSSWNAQLDTEIAELQREEIDELYHQYGMVKQAKIKSLGTILNKIDNAINELDFSEMTPTQLLDAKLKYQKALQEEYSPKKDTQEVLEKEFRL